MPFDLPEHMQLGVAAAATQIEGGNQQNSWYEWYQKGHIKDGSDPSVATNHYALYETDAALMKKMGIGHYRLGIEWARLEPKRGVYDDEAFSHYRNEVLHLQKLGIKPLLTLHHFTNPLWFEQMGAFENAVSIDIFIGFVRKVVKELGDLVSEYITINEPNVYATSGLFFGIWPPGKKSIRLTFRVLNHMCACHIKAFKLIHQLRGDMGYADTKVGYAHHMRVFAPKNPKNIWHRLCTPLLHRLFQSCISRAYLTGKACFPLKRVKGVDAGLYCDFHAINYYSRTAVHGFGDGVMDGAPVNDLGWEIYPQGIVQCSKELLALAPLPIYVTENGTCDNTDSFRCRYLYEHIKALCDSRLPVARYYHWCFTDNFEWLEGNSARFGLVHVDYATQQRTIKQSGRFYQQMIAQRGVTQQMYEAHCTTPYSIKQKKAYDV